MSNMGVLRETRRWVLPVAALILATGSTAASAAGHVDQKSKRIEAALTAPGAPRAMISLAASATSAKLTWLAFSLDKAQAQTFLRLRLYEAGRTEAASGPQPSGWVDGGEVEDHQVLLVRPAVWLCGQRLESDRTATESDRTESDGAPSPCMLRRLGLAADGQAPPPRDADGDGDVDGDDLVVTGALLRPYLLIGIGMVLLGLVILILALMMGPKKERRRI